MISVVKEYVQGTGLTVEEVDNILAASHKCTINIYTGSNTEAWNNVKLVEASAEAIEYAKSLGMVVGTAFVSEPHRLFAMGIGLMQCNTLCIQPKATPIALCVSLLNGVATVESYGAYGRRFTADVSVSGSKLIVTNVRLLGSDREFSDGITPNLANIFPYTLSAIGDNVQSATLYFNCRIDVAFDTAIANLDTSSKKRIFIKFAYGI